MGAVIAGEDAGISQGDSSLPDTPFFQANLEAFATHAPELHGRLARLTDRLSELVLLPDGGVDMSLQGQPFYGTDAVEFTEAQLGTFFAAPHRLYFNKPDPAALEGVAGGFCQDLTAKMEEKGIAFGATPTSVKSHFSVVFGLGLGLHIAPLARRTDCRVLLIIEPTLENIFHSLSVVDWCEVFEESEAVGREIVFIVKDDMEAIISASRNAIRARNPALLDGIYVYRHYSNPVLDAAQDQFQRDLFLNLSGLGFFEDELRMMVNTCSNLGQGQTMIINRQMPFHDTPLLIIGSGPSIDKDVEFIKANREKAVLMSIGTGLRGLLAQGIKPDYHVELENEAITTKIVQLVTDEFDVSGITLIASCTVQKKLAEQFDETLFFFRERTCSTMLFGEGFQTISPAGPTVANAGMAAAIRFGFKNIYLFGLDMGSKNREQFHSVGSVYGNGALAEIDVLDTPLPGNFGGTAYAESVLVWSRHSLENMLRAHGYVDCINCSDGARIEFARPALSRVVELSDPVDRRAVKEQIRGDLSVFTEGRRRQSWYLRARVGELRAVMEDATACLDRSETQAHPDLEWVRELGESLRYESGAAKSGTLSFLYGSVLLILGCSWWYDSRLADDARRAEFRRTVVAVLRETLAGMDQRIEQLYQDVDDYFSGELEAIETPADSVGAGRI